MSTVPESVPDATPSNVLRFPRFGTEPPAGWERDVLGRPHSTKIRGTHITWGELGDGPPLVLLHGLQDSHRCWRRVAPRLAERFRVILPDLPGHGLSGRPDAPYTLSWHARLVAAWMAEIGVPRAHLCGHSYGGGVAQWMLLEHRDRVDRLALVCAGGLGKEVNLPMRLAAFPVIGKALTPWVLKWSVPLVLRYQPAIFGYMEPEEQERYIRLNRLPGTDRAFHRTLTGVIDIHGQYMQTQDRAAEVEELPPVTIFWGEKDPILPVQHGQEASARGENVELVLYRDSGHFPHLDNPERFADDLLAFLTDPHRPPAIMR